ncbi:DUF2935 domain-containing protein [Clostridium sp. P21]|uniref:DUF2935 domain-containing protein n=1 Tax=Clostridium muellerianum TaxID=2716538 RepID=A0A7Y0EFM3_9CLOT|nr:DUF2935 domain-containing protein [Clostridium muellerianum]NMM62513.1 DUF2935 domain-containing protein [Clostridium muellerianum]
MKFNSIEEVELFEHQFWLQILGDHSRFILNSLSPKEEDFIKQASEFISLFDNLLIQSRQPMSKSDFPRLNQQAYTAAIRIRKFKLNILNKHITGKINMSLPPTFINHMLNELDEYLLILNALIRGKIANVGAIHLHLLWLLDGSGHASTLVSNLDPTEKELIKNSKEYCNEFDNLYSKSIEYNGYTRTGIFDFPALNKLNHHADKVMTCFRDFLDELKQEIIDKKVLGTLAPLAADHMSREECYYLTKLSMFSDIKEPKCDPTRPRIEL